MTPQENQEPRHRELIKNGINRLEALCERGVWRLGVTLCIGSALSSCYLFLNSYLEPKIDLLTPLDGLIPYWPWSISVYLSLYGVYLVAGFTLTARQYAETLIGLIAMERR